LKSESLRNANQKFWSNEKRSWIIAFVLLSTAIRKRINQNGLDRVKDNDQINDSTNRVFFFQARLRFEASEDL